MPQGSNLGPPSQQPSQPSSSSNMPNPPLTAKLATGYQSSSVPVKKAAAAGYGSGKIPRTKIKAKSSKPHIKPTKTPQTRKRKSYKQADASVPMGIQPKVKVDKGIVKEKPMKTGGG